MKTKVLMKRKLFDQEISQESKSEYFSATDLVRAGNAYRKTAGLANFNLSQFLNNQSTCEFCDEIQKKFKQVAYRKGRGRNSHTWVHPLLFIDIALSIKPEFKVEVYDWLYDNLIKYRNDSGSSYKKMSGALWERCTDSSKFPRLIAKTALKVQNACGISDWNRANEEQLELRDRIHENIYLLCNVLNNSEEAIRLGIYEATKPTRQ